MMHEVDSMANKEEQYKKLQIDALQSALKNCNKEMKLYPKKIQQLREKVSRLERKIALKEKLLPVVLKGIKKKTPVYEYEEDPVFLECQREIDTISHEETVEQLQQEIDATNDWIQNSGELELQRLTEQKVKCIEELRTLGVEVE
jgi:predicted  nucleic acid-binding Zn-ribbon protein